MSNLIRWQPFRDLFSMRRDIDRLFDEALAHPLTGWEDWSVPQVNLYQTKDDVMVEMAVPGVNPDDIDIEITGDVLTVRGETKVEEEKEDSAYHLRELRYGSFSRTLNLPAKVEADKAKADFKNGMLTLTLPKAEEVRPKTIKVTAK